MIYNHRKLTKQESMIVFALMEHYRKYDKLDIIIEMAVANPTDILTRNIKKKKKELKTQPIPEELKFCDGDSCQYQ